MNSVLSTPESKQGTHSLKYEESSYYSVIKSTCALVILFDW